MSPHGSPKGESLRPQAEGTPVSKRFCRGLIVGKFCPLHLGHELLISRARGQCDDLLVLSYTKPGFAGYGAARRAGWLQARFPDVTRHVIDDPWLAARCDERGIPQRELPLDDAPDDVHRRFVAWLLTDVLRATVDAVFTSESYGGGFAAVLSECLGTPVRHVCIDRQRTAVSVSGTQIRPDPLACRHALAPEVYADFVPRIALLGGESTGKTTLAQALAKALETNWVPEYGRDLWERQEGVLAFEDMELIARTQVLHEQQRAADARGVLICDTTPLTTLLYSEAMFGRAAQALQAHANRPYGLTLLCAPDFAFVQDGTRRDPKFREYQHQWYLDALREREVACVMLQGSLARRVETASAVIRAMGLVL